MFKVPDLREDLEAKRLALFTILKDAPHGELYPHEALAEVVEESPASARYRALVLAVGKRLERDAQRTLISVRGVGYRVALPKEHMGLAYNRHARSVRQKRRGVHILQATDVAQLDPHDRQRVADRLEFERQQLRMLRQLKRGIETLNKKQEAQLETINRQKETMLATKIEDALRRIQALEARA